MSSFDRNLPGDKTAAAGSRGRCGPLRPGRIRQIGFAAGRLCALAAGAPPVGRGLSRRSALGFRSCCGGGSCRCRLLCAPHRGRIACCAHTHCHTKNDAHHTDKIKDPLSGQLRVKQPCHNTSRADVWYSAQGCMAGCREMAHLLQCAAMGGGSRCRRRPRARSRASRARAPARRAAARPRQ